ncbi:hypothetical protein LP43_1784 [Methylophaga thiooxydans]|uniref:Uncharacterized protein n=1 Tax=Methylophaga thiooxydans TaxID=392484 RepID=A0A0A0BFV2_9GAMM|nr:hypothetical protein [Methylophaga thiooxydans]KGM06562.1 hypothetical protein LP43_1784 [Methylophaga thiooxydans]
MENRNVNHYLLSDILQKIALSTFICVLWGIVLMGMAEWIDYVSVLIVTFALLIGTKSRAVIPYLLFSLAYFLLFFLGQLLLSTELIELRRYHSALESPAVFEFSLYFLASSIGFFIFDKIAPLRGELKLYSPQPETRLTFIIWAIVLILLFTLRDVSHPALTILTKVVLPVFGFALLWSVRSKLFGILILLVTLLPVISSRHIAGQFLAWAVLMYFVLEPYVKISIQNFVKLMVALLFLSVSIFIIGTAVKYDIEKIFNMKHYITRILLVQSHSSAKLVEIKNNNPEGAAELYGGGIEYWSSLIPGVDKPVNAGDVTYKLSRDRINKTDLPYLPPGAPGELYITLGLAGMVVGGALHGFLISMLWFFACGFRASRVYSSLFTGATVFLCGIGTASLYGRINSVKEAFYVLLAIGIVTAFVRWTKGFRQVNANTES